MTARVSCPLLLALCVLCGVTPVPAQTAARSPGAFRIADILSAPMPSELVAAPDGRAIAWIGNDAGRRNIWVAEAPAWRARRLTRYAADDGQSLSAITWTADARSILFVRGGAPGSNWDVTVPINPASDPAGSEQAVWLVARAGGAARRVGAGHTPAPSPRGDVVAWVFQDTVRVAPLRTAGVPRILFRARGASASPRWSPDGRTLAFVSRRTDHSLIGIYDLTARTLRWIAPGTFRDDLPRWSPDGTRLAFLRQSGATFTGGMPLPPVRDSTLGRWSVMIAVATDPAATTEVWRMPNVPDGTYPGSAGDWALQWSSEQHVVFASELSGWVGLYVVSARGGEPRRLTPTGCEVESAVLSLDRQELLYASNCGDIDRRHVQRVPTAGGAPVDVTSGPGIEWSPAPLTGGRVAVLASDARRPAAPSLVGEEGITALDGWPLPAAFPLAQLVEPRAVVVRAADSTPIHLQVFEPAGSGPHPAVLFFHGGPQRQMLLGWNPRGYYHNAYAFNQYLASRGFVVVSVNYRGGIGYGRAFREAPFRGRLGASEYQDVLAAAAWLRARADVDSARIGLWGGSYGGYLTALGLARNSDLFAAGFDLHGVHDYAISTVRQGGASDSVIAAMRRASPVGDVTRWRSPVLLVHGDDDRNVEFQQTTDLAVRLRRLGVPMEELVLPDELHGFARHDSWVRVYEAGARFLEARLRQ